MLIGVMKMKIKKMMAKDKQKAKAYQKEYYQENKDNLEFRKKQKEYCQKNKEEKKRYDKKYKKKNRLKLIKQGQEYYQKNKKNCMDCGKKISKNAKRCIKCSNLSKERARRIKLSKIGNKNPMWKGDNVRYDALHEWIRNRKPKPEFCENCGVKPPYDLANISGRYKRDVNDFEWLCRSCHMNKDGRINNLKQNRNDKK